MITQENFTELKTSIKQRNVVGVPARYYQSSVDFVKKINITALIDYL